MKLQKQVSRVYGEKKYIKNWIVIPNGIVEDLNWKPSEELKCSIKKGKLIIEKDGKEM